MDIAFKRRFLGALRITPNTTPYKILMRMAEWPYVHISQISKSSFYDRVKERGITEDGTMRLSDHWNYKVKGEKGRPLHSVTNKPVENLTHWTLGKYNAELGMYEVIMSVPKCAKKNKQNKLTVGVVSLQMEYDIAIHDMKERFTTNIPERERKINFAFLTRQLRLEQNCGSAANLNLAKFNKHEK